MESENFSAPSPYSTDLAQGILDRLPEGCLLLGPDWIIRFINAAAARHLGMDRAAVLGRTLQDALPGFAGSLGFYLIEMTMSNRVPRHFSASIAGVSQGRLTLTVEPDQDGLLLRTWQTRPRLRRPLAVSQLAQLSRRKDNPAKEVGYQMLIANMNAGVHLSRLVRGPDGEPSDLRLLDGNRFFLNYFGFKKEDVVGQLHSVLWPKVDPVWMVHELKVATTGQPAHFEWSSPLTDLAWEVFVFSPAFETIAVVSIEITQRVVRERANALLNAQLAARATLLEESVRELDAFGSAIAHDLRAPIRHVAGFADLLERKEQATLSEQGRRYQSTIQNSAANMAELLDHLLALSRAGAKEMHREPVDLGALLEEVLAALTPEAQGRVIHWEIAELPTVQGDRTLLREVFSNLLGNALKFTRNQPEAKIQVGLEVDSGEYILSFLDNGVGFDPRQAHRLFTPFQRLHSEQQFQGSGVGLANVKRSIRRHGGRVWAEAPEHGGAAFHITLPRMLGPAGPEPA